VPGIKAHGLDELSLHPLYFEWMTSVEFAEDPRLYYAVFTALPLVMGYVGWLYLKTKDPLGELVKKTKALRAKHRAESLYVGPAMRIEPPKAYPGVILLFTEKVRFEQVDGRKTLELPMTDIRSFSIAAGNGNGDLGPLRLLQLDTNDRIIEIGLWPETERTIKLALKYGGVKDKNDPQADAGTAAPAPSAARTSPPPLPPLAPPSGG
jgi:hypothetical protein